MNLFAIRVRSIMFNPGIFDKLPRRPLCASSKKWQCRGKCSVVSSVLSLRQIGSRQSKLCLNRCSFWPLNLKAQGHVTVNKPVISIIYIVSHMWPLCSAQILVDGVNPLESYFQNSTNISAIVQHMRVSFVSLQGSKVCLQNSTVILRNIVEDLCDMAYQKYCKIVISKEVCLHYVTLPL